MVDSPTTRSAVKGLFRGERPHRSLLIPMTFSLASRVENLAFSDFSVNPTKIAHALRQVSSALQIDGLTCYVPPAEVGNHYDRPEDMLQQHGIAVACEVLHRLKITLKDEPALMVAVPGPLRLASQCQSAQPGAAWRDLIDSAARVTAALAKQFVEAGADVVLLLEANLAALQASACEWWAGLLEPIINVVRFYEALPVLCLHDPAVPHDILAAICSRTWEGGLSLPSTAAAQAFKQCQACTGVGISLPNEVFIPESQNSLEHARKLIRELQPSFITTIEDLPAQLDLKYLARTLKELR